MTKKQRAQVVELLRCAADVMRLRGKLEAAEVPRWARDEGIESFCFDVEWDVGRELGFDFWVYNDDGHANVLLEAAARVEEGSWP